MIKVALVNTIKPMAGTGDGMTEYVYNVQKILKGKVDFRLVYGVERSKKSDIGGILYSNLKIRSALKKVSGEGFDIVHIANHEVGFGAKVAKENGTRAKVMTTVHDTMRYEGGLHRGVLQKAYNRLVSGSIHDAMKYSDMIVFNSTQTYESVRSRFALPERYTVINSGVRDEMIKSPVHRRMARNGFVVGHVGALSAHKNVIFLLKVASRLRKPGFKFEIYGAGSELHSLARYKEAHMLQNVSMRGFAPERTIVDVFDSFDAFVYPSLYEGFGLPILEAQARGLPVVIYRRAKIPQEVRQYCLEAEDEDEAAAILSTLKEEGYSEARRRRAMEYARGFTWEKTALRTYEAYRSLLG